MVCATTVVGARYCTQPVCHPVPPVPAAGYAPVVCCVGEYTCMHLSEYTHRCTQSDMTHTMRCVVHPSSSPPSDDMTHPDIPLHNHPHLGMVHSWYPVSSIPKPYLLQTTRSQGVFWGCILGGPFGWYQMHRSDHAHRVVCVIMIIIITIIMIIMCVASHHITSDAPPPTTPDIAVCPTPAREHRFYTRKQGILGAFQGNVHGQKWSYFGVILGWFWGYPQGGHVRCK